MIQHALARQRSGNERNFLLELAHYRNARIAYPVVKLTAWLLSPRSGRTTGPGNNSERTAKFSGSAQIRNRAKGKSGSLLNRCFGTPRHFFFEIGVMCAQHDATAQAVESLIAGECLVPRCRQPKTSKSSASGFSSSSKVGFIRI